MAKFALLCGIPQAAQKLQMDQGLLSGWVRQLDIDELALCSEARKLVKETVKGKGIPAAAVDYDIPETVITAFITPIGIEKIALNSDKSTQTPDFFPAKRKRLECDVQTLHLAFDPAAMTDAEVKPYTTAQKIRIVRRIKDYGSLDEAAFALQTSAVKLEKWRSKIKYELFQSVHVERLYSGDPAAEGKRKSFFGEMDQALYQWWQANAMQEVDTALVGKAKVIAKVDENEPVVSAEWLKGFRRYYQI